MSSETIYLDHAAATPLDPRVLAAMQPYFSDLFYNPSSPYAPALLVRRDYDAAKQTIAHTIGAKGDELVMTAGATESINLAFKSIGGHVVTAVIEHHAVLEAAKQYDHTIVASDPRGQVSSEAIKSAIRPDTRLVSVALANNELGTVQPIRDIAAVIHAERERRLSSGDTTPIYLHSDASQGAGQLDIHVARLGVDLLTLNAGKVYGPKQVGLLWAASHVRLQPYIVGGGQERGLRSGTENVAGVIGFAKAMELAEQHRKFESERLRALRDSLQATLVQAFPEAVVSGHEKRRLPGHLHISFPGIDAERLVF
jgi:cysteine desulfurase